MLGGDLHTSREPAWLTLLGFPGTGFWPQRRDSQALPPSVPAYSPSLLPAGAHGPVRSLRPVPTGHSRAGGASAFSVHISFPLELMTDSVMVGGFAFHAFLSKSFPRPAGGLSESGVVSIPPLDPYLLEPSCY